MKQPLKNLLVGSCLAAAIVIAVFLILQQENRIVNFWQRGRFIMDSVYISPGEREDARQFADSILPALKEKGLIVSVKLNNIQSVITVSDSLWMNRSTFFKENFLTRVAVYNRVSGFTSSVIIVDQRSGRTVAHTVSPGKYELF